jgi:hypothetical protein
MENPVCDICEEETSSPVLGYLAPGTVTCQPCYEYAENEVFAYKPEQDDSDPDSDPNPKTNSVVNEKPGFWEVVK